MQPQNSSVTQQYWLSLLAYVNLTILLVSEIRKQFRFLLVQSLPSFISLCFLIPSLLFIMQNTLDHPSHLHSRQWSLYVLFLFFHYKFLMCITVFLSLKSNLAPSYLQKFESWTIHFLAGYGETGILIYCWWEWKMVQFLWREI